MTDSEHPDIPKTKRGRVASWIFQWLFNQGFVGINRITVGFVYDDEAEMLNAFMEDFPGRNRQCHDAAKRRLLKYLNRMHADGWLEKGRRYNEAQYFGEVRSGWYPTFSLSEREAARIRFGVYSADDMGRKYAG